MGKKIDFIDFSRKGGNKTLEKYGPEHFAEIGKKGGSVTKERYGIDYYKKIRQKRKNQEDSGVVKIPS